MCDSVFLLSLFLYEQNSQRCQTPFLWVSMCLLRSPVPLNSRVQHFTGHWYRLSIWTIECCCSRLSKGNFFPQNSQQNFISRCEYICLSSELWLVNFLSHCLQSTTPCSSRWCLFKSLVVLNEQVHNLHLITRSRIDGGSPTGWSVDTVLLCRASKAAVTSEGLGFFLLLFGSTNRKVDTDVSTCDERFLLGRSLLTIFNWFVVYSVQFNFNLSHQRSSMVEKIVNVYIRICTIIVLRILGWR